jgi:hypothetical protein
LKYVAFLHWLSFRAFKGGDTDGESGGGGEPPKKKWRMTSNAERGFKKDFDPSPSRLSDCLPSSRKSKPSRSMVADWWVHEHPEVKLIAGHAEWLIGFYSGLDEDELHPADQDHLKELTKWHKMKERECVGDTQVAGPSC